MQAFEFREEFCVLALAILGYEGRGVEIRKHSNCTMYASESAGDMAALQSTGSDHDLRRHQGSGGSAPRSVKILPVAQLAPAPGAPLRQGGRGALFGEPGRHKTWAETLLPSLAWMKAYQWRDSLKSDAVAGITVGTMLIPQARSSQQQAATPVLSLQHLSYKLCNLRVEHHYAH